MADELIQAKADELRKQLRNDRSKRTENESESIGTFSVHETSRIASEYVPVSNSTERTTDTTSHGQSDSSNQSTEPTERPIHGQNIGSVITRGAASIVKRGMASSSGSTSQNDRRKRQELGRSGEDYSENRRDGTNLSTGPSSSQPVSVGNLVRNVKEEPVFIPPAFFSSGNERTNAQQSERSGTNTQTTTATTQPTTQGTSPARKRGRPPLNRIVGTPENVIPFPQEVGRKNPLKAVKEKVERYIPTSSGNRLSDQEAAKLREPLKAALEDEFETLDKMLLGYAGTPNGQPIWADISDKEMDAFINAFLSLGKKSPTVATMARGATSLQDYIVGGTVLLPRIKKTGEIIRQARSQKAETKKVRRGRRNETVPQ